MTGVSVKSMDGGATLSLVSGCSWTIVPADQRAKPVVDMLSQLMGLQERDHQGTLMVVEIREQEPEKGHALDLDIVIDDEVLDSMLSVSHDPKVTKLMARSDEVRCIIRPVVDHENLAMQLHLLTLLFALSAQGKGGLLLHGALAEQTKSGVVLLGPSGVGKSTCSRRLSPPWRSLSDDLTLVVCDQKGVYWAHPWPSWGAIAQGERGGAWNVEQGVPLKALFFLEQSPQDNLQRMGAGAALCSLMETVNQAALGMSLGAKTDERCRNHLQQFENACALAGALPAYRLQVSLSGPFWREMERAIDPSGAVSS